MDTSDPWIEFDPNGRCNHCRTFEEAAPLFFRHGPGELEQLVEQIRRAGRGHRYDCVIGVSGGVDSTYVAHLVRSHGLRPIAVHMDNGWNSELSVANIEKVLKRLDIDLMTFVLDWDEFKDLQVSFLKASVPDGEIPTDHAIGAVLYQTALQHGIKHVISGSNLATEGILPVSWTYGVSDWRYINSIQRRFGTRPLRTYPHLSPAKRMYYLARGIRAVRILDHVDYQRSEVMRVLQEDLGWKYYGGKHYESIYTRFFQGYILPRKFGIDKRRAHYSTLICSGQMTRDEALKNLAESPYPEQQAAEDREYVIKKFGLTEKEFDDLMALPPRTHLDYPTYRAAVERVRRTVRKLKLRPLARRVMRLTRM
jgi:N-acetyl sugar amidotransferase